MHIGLRQQPTKLICSCHRTFESCSRPFLFYCTCDLVTSAVSTNQETLQHHRMPGFSADVNFTIITCKWDSEKRKNKPTRFVTCIHRLHRCQWPPCLKPEVWLEVGHFCALLIGTSSGEAVLCTWYVASCATHLNAGS